jgi:hypothetical protein
MDGLRCEKPPMCAKVKFQIISYDLELPSAMFSHGNLEYGKNDKYIDFFHFLKHLLV